jgi:hypothetical protein
LEQQLAASDTANYYKTKRSYVYSLAIEIYGLLRDIPTLPAGISKLENLEILDLFGNGLISLSP